MAYILMPLEDFTSVGSLSPSRAITVYSRYLYEEDVESHLRSNQAVLREIITYIESIEYDCEYGLACNVRTLKNYLEVCPKVQQLVELCKDRDIAVFILGHMLEISTRKIDADYRNPWELAVTTYLYAITQARPELVQSAISAAWRLKNGFWTVKYIQTFLQ
jgi:hypothetical protein